jgi:DNA gyrase/topoisomerase IV subunit A
MVRVRIVREPRLGDPARSREVLASLARAQMDAGGGVVTFEVAVPTDLSDEDLIVEEDMVVTVSHEGYIKRNQVTLYRSQRQRIFAKASRRSSNAENRASESNAVLFAF